MTFYLRVLLCDHRGWNLRNAVSHGLLGPGSFNRAVSDRLAHALLVLAAATTALASDELTGEPET